jgi:uncharacterized protein YggE
MPILSRLLISLSILLAAGGAWAGTVTVVGNGQVSVPPDQATITLSVTSENEEAAIALQQNSEDMAAITNALLDAGVDELDLQTSNLSMYPQWRQSGSLSGDTRQISHFVVSHQLSATIKQLPDLGRILDVVAREGANGFQNLAFGVENLQPLQDEARAIAVADAKRKAVLYAKAAGMTLGLPRDISEASSVGAMPMMRAEAAMMSSSSVPISQGQIGVSAQITIVFDMHAPIE